MEAPLEKRRLKENTPYGRGSGDHARGGVPAPGGGAVRRRLEGEPDLPDPKVDGRRPSPPPRALETSAPGRARYLERAGGGGGGVVPHGPAAQTLTTAAARGPRRYQPVTRGLPGAGQQPSGVPTAAATTPDDLPAPYFPRKGAEPPSRPDGTLLLPHCRGPSPHPRPRHPSPATEGRRTLRREAWRSRVGHNRGRARESRPAGRSEGGERRLATWRRAEQRTSDDRLGRLVQGRRRPAAERPRPTARETHRRLRTVPSRPGAVVAKGLIIGEDNGPSLIVIFAATSKA
nr:translation initiation factor IF-2-like [Ovis aries]